MTSSGRQTSVQAQWKPMDIGVRPGAAETFNSFHFEYRVEGEPKDDDWLEKVDRVYTQKKPEKKITPVFTGQIVRCLDYEIYIDNPQDMRKPEPQLKDIVVINKMSSTMRDRGLYKTLEYEYSNGFYSSNGQIRDQPEHQYDHIYINKKPEKRITPEFVKYIVKPWGFTLEGDNT